MVNSSSKRTLASPIWLKRPAAMREFTVAQYMSVDISKKHVRRTGPTPGRGDGLVTKGFETSTPWRGGAQCCAANGDREEARVASLEEARNGDGTGSEGPLDSGAGAVGGGDCRLCSASPSNKPACEVSHAYNIDVMWGGVSAF